MKRVAIWPFATPMDNSGKLLDEHQSSYSRGFCRAIAEGLLRTNVCEVAVCMPIVRLGGLTSWAVTGKELNLDEALEIMLPEGTDFFMWGMISIAESIELHVLLISQSENRLILDRNYSFPSMRMPNCLAEVVTDLTFSITGRPLTNGEYKRLHQWGTNSAEAYLAYTKADAS